MKCILLVLAGLVGCSLAQQAIFDDYWTKLSTRPVCFESKNSKPGIFKPRYRGFLAAVKLVHRSGHVTCNYRGGKSLHSNWGCVLGSKSLNVLVTDRKNRILFPKVGAKFRRKGGLKKARFYGVPGFDSRSRYLVLQHGFNVPLYVGPKSILKLWYGEDLYNYAEGDNRGRVCADVYGYFM